MKRTLRFTWRGSQFKLWNLSGALLWIWNSSANIPNPDPSKVPYDAPLPVGRPAPLPPHHWLHALHDGQDASCHGLSQVLFEALVASDPKKIILLLNSRNTPESVSNLLKYKNGDRLLTPRLYTEDKFCCRFHQWIFNKYTYSMILQPFYHSSMLHLHFAAWLWITSPNCLSTIVGPSVSPRTSPLRISRGTLRYFCLLQISADPLHWLLCISRWTGWWIFIQRESGSSAASKFAHPVQWRR